MLVSFCIFAYNEEHYIKKILSCLKKQDYPHENIEVVLIDSNSSDKTKQIMENFKNKNERSDIKNDGFGFKEVRVLDNPKKTQPCAWNVAIDNFKGDILLRVDAHALIPENFIRNNVKHIQKGDYVCGGPRHLISEGKDDFSKTLLMAERSAFGAGIAPYRGERKTRAKEVKSLFHAAFRREVFDKVGHFNESLVRTEDNDMNFRIRRAGFKLRYHEDIISYQYMRPDLLQNIKQKFLNGFWVGKTLGINPSCIQIFHLAPFVFVLAVIGGGAAYKVSNSPEVKKRFKRLLDLYGLVTLAMSAGAVIREKENRNITNIFLPLIFLLIHTSYGLGTAAGILAIPYGKMKARNDRHLGRLKRVRA